MNALRRLLHRHYDPDWRRENVHDYFECRCGARRVRRAFANLDGPLTRPGWWPLLVDEHGRHLDDSGWVKP
jgi:hypothetical protein